MTMSWWRYALLVTMSASIASAITAWNWHRIMLQVVVQRDEWRKLADLEHENFEKADLNFKTLEGLFLQQNKDMDRQVGMIRRYEKEREEYFKYLVILMHDRYELYEKLPMPKEKEVPQIKYGIVPNPLYGAGLFESRSVDGWYEYYKQQAAFRRLERESYIEYGRQLERLEWEHKAKYKDKK